MLVRYSTNARTVKNHPIYLFNYIHAAIAVLDSGHYDKVDLTYKPEVQTYANAWITGFSDGSITAVRASPNGAAATGAIVEEYVTHRDFPRSTSL